MIGIISFIAQRNSAFISSSVELCPFRMDPRYLKDFSCSKSLESISTSFRPIFFFEHLFSFFVHLQLIQNVLPDFSIFEMYQ